MPRILEEIQFPSLTDVVKPKSGISLYNSNGVLKVLHADGTEKIIATGDIGEIGLDDYYTKGEVDDILSALGPTGFEVLIVDELPSIGEPGKIYLLPNGDIYTEYLYINNDWEMIGSTGVDLSAYALKSEIPVALGQLENDKDYITRTEANSSYIKEGALEGYALKEDIPSLDNYALKSEIPETYNKREIDNLIRNVSLKATFRTWTEV